MVGAAALDLRAADRRRYGGFASDSVKVPYPDAMLVPIPDGVARPPWPAFRQHPGCLANRAPALAERAGIAVLIAMGAGSIALYSIAIALALGAERVDVVGGSERDRELADEARSEHPRRGVSAPGPASIRSPSMQAPTPTGINCVLKSTDGDGYRPASGSTSSPRRCPFSTCSLRGSPSSPGARTCGR